METNEEIRMDCLELLDELSTQDFDMEIMYILEIKEKITPEFLHKIRLHLETRYYRESHILKQIKDSLQHAQT